jgi:hypothetical protein
LTDRSALARGRRVRAFFALVVVAQLAFIARGYVDPHSYFGFQPFPESSTWSAEIVAVQRDGTEIDVRGGWAGYEWNDLVHWDVLEDPWQERSAYVGVAATLDFLQGALDWIAAHTPDDTGTAYLEARVTYDRNTHGARYTVLRSEARP